MGGDEESIVSIKLKVKSWKDLTNGMQFNRHEWHIKAHFPLDFESSNNQQAISNIKHHEDQGIK